MSEPSFCWNFRTRHVLDEIIQKPHENQKYCEPLGRSKATKSYTEIPKVIRKEKKEMLDEKYVENSIEEIKEKVYFNTRGPILTIPHPRLIDYFCDTHNGAITERSLTSVALSPASSQHFNPAQALRVKEEKQAFEGLGIATFQEGLHIDEYSGEDMESKLQTIKPATFNHLVIPNKPGLMERISLKQILKLKPTPKPFKF